jgi:hypothetical protein
MPSAPKTRAPVAALLLLVLAAAGCQLLVDLDGLKDQHCGPDEKACPGIGRCVKKDSTATGCIDAKCQPCAPQHAIAMCDEDLLCSYIPTSCFTGWGDCDPIKENGCETDLTHNRMHCGYCHHLCDNPLNGTAGCSEGECVIGSCNKGWEDCDHKPETGCEQQIWTDLHCLGCNLPCPEGTHCDQGVCL